MPKALLTDILDMELIQSRSQLDFEFFKMLMGVFFEDAPPLIIEIQQVWNSGKSEVLINAGHKLKGMCANIGAEALKNLAEKVELSGNNHTLINGEHLPKQLESTYEETKEHITNYIKKFGN